MLASTVNIFIYNNGEAPAEAEAEAEAAENPSQAAAGPVRSVNRLVPPQRKALFAAFDEVFGSRSPAARYVFTRLVLGLSPSVEVSWSEYKATAITYLDAARVLVALNDLKAAL